MWVFNVFLYLCFLFNQPVYDAMKVAGATCYAYVPVAGEQPVGPPPVCFYER